MNPLELTRRSYILVSAVSAALMAAAICAVVGFIAFTLAGVDIGTTAVWLAVLVLVCGSGTYVGTAIGTSAAARRTAPGDASAGVTAPAAGRAPAPARTGAPA